MLRPQWICRRCLLLQRHSLVSGEHGSAAATGLLRRTRRRHYSSEPDVIDKVSTSNAELAIRSVTFLSDSLLRRAKQLSSEHKALEEKLLDGFDQKVATKAGTLRNVSEALAEYEKTVESLEELKALLADTKSPDMQQLAAEDVPEVAETLGAAGRSLTRALVPVHPFAHRAAILEIRPGTGGGEATLFANDLFKMYTAYCVLQSWPTRVLSVSTTAEQGGEGLSEVIFAVKIPGSYGVLRHEAGVHRVQRIPTTEKMGRMHTSTANVMVLPSFEDDTGGGGEEDELSAIDMKEVRIEIMRARGAGGQHVNTTDSAVRMTHEPTGITVSMQDSRSQHKNREMALQVLKARVADRRRREREEEELKMRRSSVKVAAGRSDKLRTYNYSQSRVTDHRCNFSLHDLPSCMAGEGLGQLLDKVAAYHMDEEIEDLIRQQEEKQQEGNR